MLRWRLLLGTFFVAVLIGLFWLDARMQPPGVVLFPLALVLSVLASGEFLGLVQARGLRPLAGVVYVGSLLTVSANIASVALPDTPLGALGWPLAAMGLSLLLAFLGEMRRYERPGEVMERLGLGFLGVGYVGLLLSFVCQMRLLGPGHDGTWGIAAIASLVITVKMCDVGAYTVGRLIGRHKMAPVLSPGKTLEGAGGGIAFACLGSWLALVVLLPRIVDNPPEIGWWWAPFGAVVGLAGMFGDLAESLIKRDVGCKDSSSWMPGFGGVLDLLDSILFAAPVAYLMWLLMNGY